MYKISYSFLFKQIMKNILLIATLLLFSINSIFSQELVYTNNSETNVSDLLFESKDVYTMSSTGINSKFSDIGATFFMDKFIMYSSRKTGAITGGKDELNNTPYQSLYCLNIDINGNLSRPNFFAYALNAEGNEAGISFSPDQKTVYITKSDKTNTNNYQLFKFDFDGVHTWINEISAGFNSTEYSIENPCVTPDGKKMYFASNMPGGFGGFDIYVADINEKGMPVNPKNLGIIVNTSKDEKFPYVTQGSNEIYFSSNGHAGYGNFDVFVSKIKTNRYSTPINLGKTFNSPFDEVAFILANKNRGFVSSNRISESSFDIYKFEFLKTPNTLQGIVFEKDTKTALPNTNVNLFDDDGKTVASQLSNQNGQFNFVVEPADNYVVTAKKDGYLNFELPITTSIGNSVSNIELRKEKVEIPNNAIVIENIYFDFNKYLIRTESTFSLNKVVSVLTENPTMTILINAHTDSKGPELVNITLSNKRALEAKKYLISRGILSNRIETKGYGETKSLSNCGDNCTELQYIADRRIELLIK